MIDIEYPGQVSLFDSPKLRITKPVRLIELFSGIGSQAKALKRLGVQFESWGAYDIDKYAVGAYNAIHGTNYVPTDITKLRAEDLGIVDRDKFTYLLTPSLVRTSPLPGIKKAWQKGAVQEADCFGKSRGYSASAATISLRSSSWKT